MESGCKALRLDKARDSRLGLMVLFTRATGSRTKLTVMVVSSMLMAMFTQDSGLVIKLMAEECTAI